MSYVAADRHRSCVGRAAPHGSDSGADFQSEGCSDWKQVAASKKTEALLRAAKTFFSGHSKNCPRRTKIMVEVELAEI